MSDSCECAITNYFEDSTDFLVQKIRKSIKIHKCDECGRKILKKEIYENAHGKWNGEILTFKTCFDCLSII